MGEFQKLRFILKIFINHIRCFFDSAGIPCGVFSVSSIGTEKIDQAIDRKQGIIILCSHFGPWRSIFQCLKFPKDIYVLGQRATGYSWNDKFVSNEEMRNKVTELGNIDGQFSLLDAYSALEKGNIVGMMGDRMNENKRETVKFLNVQAYLPVAPFRLANKSGAVIIPVFTYKTTDRTILLHFYDPILPGQSPEAMQLQYIRLLEENVLKFPENFYPPLGDWIDNRP